MNLLKAHAEVNIHTDDSNNIVRCNQLFLSEFQVYRNKVLMALPAGVSWSRRVEDFPIILHFKTKTVKEENFDRVDDWLDRESDILYCSHQF